MMDNSAAPSYFNGGSRQEYNDYRYILAVMLLENGAGGGREGGVGGRSPYKQNKQTD